MPYDADPDRADLLRDIPLAQAGLDRHAERRTDRDLITRLLADPATRVLPLAAGRAPGDPGLDGGQPALRWRAPTGEDAAYESIYLGQTAGSERLAVLLPPDQAGSSWLGLRGHGADLAPVDAEALTTAVALANWHATHTHCPRCGTPTEIANSGWIRRCPADRSEHFPRTDPAVIMAVLDADDRLLLARHPSWPPGRLSVLAGFVEPGESLTMAVCREVREEVGVTVRDVRYLGDQPWPFPNSIMLGFEARAEDPTLRLDPAEIAEAHWVSRADYHAKVDDGAWGRGGSTVSISRRLILRWLHQGGPEGSTTAG
ncbi:MAG: NAD(+) diphosphatase [Tetrasphaera sp.]